MNLESQGGSKLARLTLLALSGAAFFAWRRQRRHRDNGAAAYAQDLGIGRSRDGVYGEHRPAGPEAMRDPGQNWSDLDQASDESFPASDPPAVS